MVVMTSVADVRALFGSSKTPADLLEHRRGDVLSVLRGFAAACDAGDTKSKSSTRTSPPDVRPALELLDHVSNDDARRDDDVALVVLTHLKILSRTHAVAFGERSRATLVPGMETLVRVMIDIDRRMMESQPDEHLSALAAEAAGVALNACSHPANAEVFAVRNSGGVDALLSWLAVADAPCALGKNAAGALQTLLYDKHGRRELKRVNGLEKTLRALRARVNESEKTAYSADADAIVARLTGALHNFTSDADYALDVRAACGDIDFAMFRKLVLSADPATAQSAAGIASNVARARRARLGFTNSASEEDVTFAFARDDAYGEDARAGRTSYKVPQSATFYEVPQSATAMSDADIDAAVRFCDDVLSAPTLILLPPTLEFGAANPASCLSSWKHRTVTYPVARIETPDVPALFVKIEIPLKGVWDASVVTASGACVARWSQAPAKSWSQVLKPPAAPLEWGGKHFGEVAVDLQGNKGRCCVPAGQAIHAKGPSQDIVFAEDLNNKRNDLKALGMKIMVFSCFTLNLCALLPLCEAENEPYEALFKTVGGEEIGGYKIETPSGCCQENSLPKTEAVVHFGSMTAEQRRLALVTMMQGAAVWAHPEEGGG
jgi:hypothetical protein